MRVPAFAGVLGFALDEAVREGAGSLAVGVGVGVALAVALAVALSGALADVLDTSWSAAEVESSPHATSRERSSVAAQSRVSMA